MQVLGQEKNLVLKRQQINTNERVSKFQRIRSGRAAARVGNSGKKLLDILT